jgi:hypothetical protein
MQDLNPSTVYGVARRNLGNPAVSVDQTLVAWKIVCLHVHSLAAAAAVVKENSATAAHV